MLILIFVLLFHEVSSASECNADVAPAHANDNNHTGGVMLFQRIANRQSEARGFFYPRTSNLKIAAGGTGQTEECVFQLGLELIGSVTFFAVLAGMFTFTLCVDQALGKIDDYVGDEGNLRMLWQRMSSELMMFGIVALSIFTCRHFFTLDHSLFILIEYADIMGSLACCSLIVIVGAIVVAHDRLDTQWSRYEAMVDVEEPVGRNLRAGEFKALAQSFVSMHQLPSQFLFCTYLHTCFLLDCCELMCISWHTWLVFIGVSLLALLVKGYDHPGAPPSLLYLEVILVIHTCVLFAHLGLFYMVNKSYAALIARTPFMLREPADEAHRVHDVGENWSARLKFAIQLGGVTSMFLIAHYLMNVVHIIRTDGHASLAWYLAVIPLLVCIIFIIPSVINRFSIVDAYYGGSPDALDNVLTAISQREDDIRYVRQRWNSIGRPKHTACEGPLDEKGVKMYLRELGLHVSGRRARRIFTYFDVDKDGRVTSDEIVKVLKGNALGGVPSLLQKKASTSALES